MQEVQNGLSEDPFLSQGLAASLRLSSKAEEETGDESDPGLRRIRSGQE